MILNEDDENDDDDDNANKVMKTTLESNCTVMFWKPTTKI